MIGEDLSGQSRPGRATLGWAGIVRLGLVQAGLGAVVVLVTSTLNRVMQVELGLPALVPGAFVALHYIVQALRPRLGYGADVGGRRTPWIVGGIGIMALGAAMATGAVGVIRLSPVPGLLLATAGFLLVGLGVGAAGTNLLTLLAASVTPRLRGPAATIVWIMMIAGIVVTAMLGKIWLSPFSDARLFQLVSFVGLAAVVVAALAVWGIEGNSPAAPAPANRGFLPALRDVWSDPQARGFAIFVFVSMMAYSAQELVIEPYAGQVFGLAPNATAGLTGQHHAGVLVGMAGVGIASYALGGMHGARYWTMGGCLGSALAVAWVAWCGLAGAGWALVPAVIALGVANGVFAVAAIGAMMGLAGQGREPGREGTRMGLWGAAQALAFGAGGLFGTGMSDLARAVIGTPAPAYAAVFATQAALFLVAAWLAAGVFGATRRPALAIA